MRAASIFTCALLLGMMSDGTSRAQDAPELEIPGVHARLFLDIQKLAPCDKAAPESLTADCLESIWSIIDITGDGLLSVAEINRFVRIVAGGAAYEAYVDALEAFDASRKSDPAAEPPANNETGGVFAAGIAGAVLTPALIANLDYNNDGRLSRGEVFHDSDLSTLIAAGNEQRDQLPIQVLKALQVLQGYFGNNFTGRPQGR